MIKKKRSKSENRGVGWGKQMKYCLEEEKWSDDQIQSLTGGKGEKFIQNMNGMVLDMFLWYILVMCHHIYSYGLQQNYVNKSFKTVLMVQYASLFSEGMCVCVHERERETV